MTRKKKYYKTYLTPLGKEVQLTDEEFLHYLRNAKLRLVEDTDEKQVKSEPEDEETQTEKE